jgi:hypothetical protein
LLAHRRAFPFGEVQLEEPEPRERYADRSP